jgi:ABC-type antimicrobial peptide transport system permease subunit
VSKMRRADYVLLAFGNLTRQRLRTLLAVSTVAIGAASITLMLSLVFGVRSFYLDQFKTSGKLQQVVVNKQVGLDFAEAQRASTCESCTDLTDSMAKTIQSYSHVVGLSKTADVGVFESTTLDNLKQRVKSVHSYEPNGVVNHTLLAGQDFRSSDSTGKIMVGQQFADGWGYKGHYQDLVGKTITLTTIAAYNGEGANLPDPVEQFKKCLAGCQPGDLNSLLKPATLKATVVAVQSDESSSLVVPLQWAQKLLENQRYEITAASQAAYSKAFTAWNSKGKVGAQPLPDFTLATDSQIKKNGYTAFIVKTDSESHVDGVAQKIQELGVGAVGARAYIQNQLDAFDVISLILGVMGAISLIVAAIGIINIMVMAVLERTREIGVIRALGARRSTISRLFTVEAAMIGVIGGFFGLLSSYVLIQFANLFINYQLSNSGLPARNIIGMPIWLLFTVMFICTITGVLAGLYPAKRAALLSPVDALRHN